MGVLDIATKPLRTAGRAGGALARQGLDRTERLRAGLRARPRSLDDVTIARKVESEIFRIEGVQKGKIDVNVADGVVFLRGTAKNPGQVKAIEARAHAVSEVRDVQNLLHLPKTPARTRADTPKRRQATRRKKGSPPAPRTPARAASADRTGAVAGDTPAELAARRAGRAPAPLGSEEPPPQGPEKPS